MAEFESRPQPLCKMTEAGNRGTFPAFLILRAMSFRLSPHEILVATSHKLWVAFTPKYCGVSLSSKPSHRHAICVAHQQIPGRGVC
jgi:hypothetical protein